MTTRLASVLLLSLALITSACGASMKTPDIKQNPHPKIRYEITLTIDGAPGPFDAITASVDYRVANDQCVPLTPFSGARIAPESTVPLVLTRENDNLYKGTLFLDLMRDEDYYGLGVCHWSVVAAGASLKIKNVAFSPDLFKNALLSQKPVTRYFSNRSYAHTEMERVDIGNADRSDFGPESNETFSITLSAKEDFQ